MEKGAAADDGTIRDLRAPALPLAADTFHYLDALRAVAAILVTLGHGWDLVFARAPGPGDGAGWHALYHLSGFGHSGRIAFFVLSGLLIARIVVVRAELPGFWRRYLFDRLTRLELVLLPALVLGLVLDTIGTQWLSAPLYAGATGAVTMPEDVPARLSAGAFAANLFFLQTVFAPAFGSNGPLWSLAFEFWYYLWFPALWLLWRRRPSLALATLGVGWFAHPMVWTFPCWLAGTLVCFALDAARSRGFSADRALLPVAAAAFAAVMLLAHLQPRSTFPLDWTIAASAAVLLFALCYRAPAFPPRLQWLARFGGRASFSLYAIHYPLMAFVVALILPDQRLAPGWPALGLWALMLFAAFVAAWLFAQATERNTGALRRWLRGRKFVGDKPRVSR